jgi:peroxiredoxin
MASGQFCRRSSEAPGRIHQIFWAFAVDQSTRRLKRGGERSDIREGGTFPDYRLADQGGKARSLSELQGGNAMVLHLSRGGFDPKEHRFLRHLVDAYPDFRNAYTRLVLISTDNQLNINEFRDAVGATWPFLSDAERMIQKDLDFEEFTDEPHDPMIPHTFVVDTLEEPIRYTEGRNIGIKR